ncbi:MAG: transketolase [Candidatus Omnitrophica bacterium]|nr:transketolase [Candidatus Omnitrophota bacterium]
MLKIKDYKRIARDARKKIVIMHSRSNSSHIGSAFSVVEILVSLYFCIMRIKPDDPCWEGRDRFILSKGHAASALYAVLALKGFFPENILDTYAIDGGKLFGHVTKDVVPGAETSTGSLGHGLSIGAGMAIAGKYDKRKFRVFVLMSDGECDEGAIWETALFASHHKLDNLVAIIDYNKLQSFGRTNEVVNLEPLAKKWEAFGWAVREVDGHSFPRLIRIFSSIPLQRYKPNLIIAHTIKGKGISFMENKLEWHYKSPDETHLAMALNELKIK